MLLEVAEKHPQGATQERFRIFLRDHSGADLEEIQKEAVKAYKSRRYGMLHVRDLVSVEIVKKIIDVISKKYS